MVGLTLKKLTHLLNRVSKALGPTFKVRPFKALADLQVRSVLLEPKVHRVHRVLQVHRVLLDLLVMMVLADPVDLPVSPVLMELTVSMASKDLRVPLVLWAHQVPWG